MKFSTREDIDAPADKVFEELCDFENFERQAIRRGANVTRTDKLNGPCKGMTWDAGFPMRGKFREVTLFLDRFEAPQMLGISATSQNIEADFALELIPLSRVRTRVTVGLELTPKTLSARLMIQSLKLAKSSLQKKFKLRVAEYAQSVEARLTNKV